MKTILEKLYQYHTLSQEEAKQIFIALTKSEFNEYEMTAFLTAFNFRTPTLNEIKGFRDAILELSVQIYFPFDTIDLCGTGGDGKNTFNISTLASFVVAGAGYKVTKHGNYSASSVSGSSHMLEYFGYEFTTNENILLNELKRSNICFLHAPLFHPSLKLFAPIRKKLHIKTFFNILGPLVNPCNPKYQISGVFDLQTARIFKHIFNDEEKQFAVLHGLSGFDEVSLTDKTKYYAHHDEGILEASSFGFKTIKLEQIRGGNSIKENATIFMNVLQNKSTEAQKNVVLANSAVAIKTIENISLREALLKAKLSLEEGNALDSFQKLLNK